MKKFIYLIFSLINVGLTALYISLSSKDIIPMHYNVQGIADSYTSKWFNMIFPCVLLLFGIVYAVFNIVMEHRNKEGKNKKYIQKGIGVMFAVFLILFWVITVVTTSGIPSIGDSIMSVITIILGASIVFISNMFPKIKQNSAFGIRTIATTSSETVWKKTHKLGAYLGVAGGAVMIICGIIGFAVSGAGLSMLYIGLGIYIVIGVLIPCIYASTLYRKEKHNRV